MYSIMLSSRQRQALLGCLSVMIALLVAESHATAAEPSPLLDVGAFNMKIFGQNKIENQEAINVIVRIILRYDLVLLQEIRDISETAIQILHNQVNSASTYQYDMVVSSRLGRSSSKEQYAYMYRIDQVTLVTDYVFSDPNDVFEREPYIALFESSLTAVSRFAVAGIHTRPDSAWMEIDFLTDVHEDIKTKLGVEEVIFAGDFNADCSYVPGYRWEQVRLRTDPQYKWLIEDDVDTTVASSTNCAYDRFVIAGIGLQSAIVPCSATAFRFDSEYGLSNEQAGNVSDHYPIGFTFLPSEFRSNESSLIIGAFNIQVFGRTKASKDDVMDILAKIVNRYDLVLLQEIRDLSGTAIESLLELSNRNNRDPFEMALSERLGRSTSKEQYAYFYRPSKLELMSTAVYNDSVMDVFEREPYVAHFKSPTTYTQEFAMAGIHTTPDEAVSEIDRMVDVYTAIQEKLGLEDVILAGDFNADCSYVPKYRWPEIRLKTDPRFCWLVNNEADTTVKSTDCAYDRLVIAGDGMKRGVLPYTAAIFPFDTTFGLNQTMAAEVSDHYPVELKLRKLHSSQPTGDQQSTPDRKQEL